MLCYKCSLPATRFVEPSAIVLMFLSLNQSTGPFCAGACDDCAKAHDKSSKDDKYFSQKKFKSKVIPAA